MLPLNGKHGVVISRVPVMQNGLGGVMTRHFPDFEITYRRSMQELTLLQLRRAGVVIADISGEYRNPRGTLEQYYGLMNQYRDIHWIFLVSRPLYPLAVELLMRPESTLLSDMEPIEGVINAIRAGSERAERISQTLLIPETSDIEEESEQMIALTHSERKVLRLLGKGWGINQIATLLNKSNKTISAQKNSAMRRLSLRSNADMYAWISSTQGMRELSLMSAYGEFEEWKRPLQQDISPSSKAAQ
ncbi:Response regulator containing a CheY-like receiver domain and an HTH DNA-binding domain [Enterobacter hormaechei]|uniref:Response regulator transcription factor n=2 Tax=Enterobacter cloacae complex TaxID=354276 RepID=A0A6L3Y732_9ENTR|nr:MULTISPECIES: LuxR C-terminal-related transcriptional regulator [Enterobacter cloacae complex]EHF4961730.1 response regulator transcription factor [Enterobacter hormaechei]EHF4977921.1 response regulator transcription factor [Enterobacter hormaechei]EHF4981625.1 response regulator transcription factor [Enterobacter hormaechei]EHF4985585.1 response regulator transcription factor [Enterobacter hormaechei]EHF5027452.1 response regulator transcription factor [Enterobacter hormaechei]